MKKEVKKEKKEKGGKMEKNEKNETKKNGKGKSGNCRKIIDIKQEALYNKKELSAEKRLFRYTMRRHAWERRATWIKGRNGKRVFINADVFWGRMI